jgi:hypothetical protein
MSKMTKQPFCMKRYSWILLGGLALLGAACEQKPDNLKLTDQFVVSTNDDPDANFSSYATYAIPDDTIGFYSNNSNDTILTSKDSDLPDVVLEALRNEIETRGYTRVARNATPDLGINVTLANDFNVFQQVIYPGGYGGYPGGYGGYYGGYYGYSGWYYQPYVNTVAYNTGVIIIEIIDLKNRTPDNKVKVVWTAYMGDVYSSVNWVKQTQEGVTRAFDQSPRVQR